MFCEIDVKCSMMLLLWWEAAFMRAECAEKPQKTKQIQNLAFSNRVDDFLLLLDL